MKPLTELVRNADIVAHTARSRRLRLAYETWEHAGEMRFRQTGTVTLPSGISVEVCCSGNVDCKDTILAMYCTLRGVVYSVHLWRIGVHGPESIRRAALAFVDRLVKNGGKQ